MLRLVAQFLIIISVVVALTCAVVVEVTNYQCCFGKIEGERQK